VDCWLRELAREGEESGASIFGCGFVWFGALCEVLVWRGEMVVFGWWTECCYCCLGGEVRMTMGCFDRGMWMWRVWVEVK
jgi:hypothetical protein